MKKTTISVSYDEEKLSALKLYLEGSRVNVTAFSVTATDIVLK